jgi:glycosyltransferase involved in cell wall biosynthesis
MAAQGIGAQPHCRAEHEMTIGLIARRILPTLGFHRAVALFPEIEVKVPGTRLLIAGEFHTRRFPEYTRDFLDLLKGSRAKTKIRFLRNKLSRKKYLERLREIDLVLLPWEAGGKEGDISDALFPGKPVIASDLKVFKKMFMKAGRGLIAADIKQMRDQILSVLKVKIRPAGN